jgi:tetrahydromethanopterin S-methyltransferase subunit F
VDKKLYRGLLIGSVLALTIWVILLMILIWLT